MVSIAPSKIMTALLFSMDKVILLLYTACKRFILSPHNHLWIMLNIVVIVIYLLHRVNSKHAIIQTPLVRFPSLSRPLVSFTSISLSQPLASFRSISQVVSLPSISLPTIFNSQPPFKNDFAVDTVVTSSAPEPDRNIYVSREAPDEEGNMSMEDAWNAILARSGATPVKLNSEIQDINLSRVVLKAKKNNSATGRKKKEKRTKKIEEKEEGWKQRDALVIIPHDDLSRRADTFIQMQYDYLRRKR